MKALIIFNTIVSLGIVAYMLYLYFPFYIDINRTFWCKRAYSVTLLMRTYPRRRSKSGGSSSKGIITIPFRNEEKIKEWDSKMFHSGEYKKS